MPNHDDLLMPYPTSNWHNFEKTKFRFHVNYGIHPSLHTYGCMTAHPATGPYHQMPLSEHVFEEQESGLLWYWEPIPSLEWRLVPKWIEFCELPVSIKA